MPIELIGSVVYQFSGNKSFLEVLGQTYNSQTFKKSLSNFQFYYPKIQVSTNDFVIGTRYKLQDIIPIALQAHNCREAIKNRVTTNNKCQ